MTHRRGPVVCAALAASTLVLGFAHSALADTFTATRTDDPTPGACRKHDCSLREALIAANAHSGNDTIVLPAKAYQLQIPPTGADDATTGDLNVAGPLRIEHPGKGKATIDGGALDRVIDVLPGANLSASKLSITNGTSLLGPTANSGGGILDEGALELSHSVVALNSTQQDNVSSGGGLAVEGRATLDRVKVETNLAGNIGGGVAVIGGAKLVLSDSTISGNTAEYAGGGLGLVGQTAHRAATLNGVTISGNKAQSDGGGGGGIFVEGNSHAKPSATNVTIAGNTSNNGGGGIWDYSGDLQLNAATIAYNTADANSTNPSPSGGGIYENSDNISFRNSIVARNVDLSQTASPAPDCYGTAANQNHNLVGLGAGCDGGGSNIATMHPKLGLLDDYGGPTQTVALRRGSPAVDHASRVTSPKRDQRGFLRDSRPDIGAFEFGAGP